MVRAMGFGLLDCLVHGRRIGDPIHKKYLVNGKTEVV
jgi:hypothetical protein